MRNLHYEKFADGTVNCIEDEIPFELPDGWEWSRLASICSLISDIDHKMPKAVDNGVLFLSAKDLLNDGTINYTDDVKMISEEDFLRLSRKALPQKNDIIYSRIGACLGKARVVTKDIRFIVSYSCCTIRPVIIDSTFLASILDGDFVLNQAKEGTQSVGVPDLGMASIKQFLIPIPPLIEQQRIDGRLQYALNIVQQISTERDDLSLAVAQAKSKILDLAIRGKLVPQNPDDEPASVLLERIRGEKEDRIRQGKIKRDKKESIIFRGEDNSYYEKIGSVVICIDEEVPFEIPDTWEWMRLESCCIKEIRRGKSPKYIDESGTLVFAQKCNTKYSGIDVGLALFLDESTLGRYPDDEYMHDGDVIINSTGTGTLGRVGIYHATDNHRGLPIVPDSHVTVIRATHSIQAFYMYAAMKANQSELEKKGEGSTNQKELKPLTLKEMLIPIPPYSEQERITSTITAAFSTITAIEKSLN